MTTPDRLAAALIDRYRIERELGAGGMATVYLAADLKHDRKVAIKVLKPELAAVLGVERFVVEIKTTAAMSHPHILPLFDSGTADGFLFYVMPYIEGETIREKLNRETQFGVEESVRIAREVADALDYAHRHGVIHRDIKPENILLHDGRAMVMDFGIALAVSAAAGGRMTETGLSLGTPHYMSPEQATAEKEITGRSDQYSLASVLYEMLAGQPPHIGGAAQQVIMKIITEQATPVNTMRKNVPANVVAALAKALEKLPADRFDSVRAFADALASPQFATTTATTSWRAGAGGGVSTRAFALTAAVAGVAALAAAWSLTRPEPPKVVTRVTLALPEGQRLADAFTQWRLALSPDGQTVVYSGGPADRPNTQLWVRRLDELTATPLDGTEGAMNPAFSPDGQKIVFVVANPSRTLRVVPVAGGPTVALTDSLVDIGGTSWSSDGYIYYDGTLRGDGIARIRASGGTPEVATLPDTAAGERYHVNPSALPDARGILFTAFKGFDLDAADVAVLDAKTGKHTILVHGVLGRYSPSGHLIYVTATGTMMAVPFDLASLRVTGEATAIAEGVSTRAISRAEVQLSATGTLLYTAGTGGRGESELVWRGRDGRESAVDSTFTGRFVGGRLSPDGRRVAVVRSDHGGNALLIKQLDRGPSMKIVDGVTGVMWEADGRSLLISGLRGLERVPADGSRLPQLITAKLPPFSFGTLSPDGKQVVFAYRGPLTQYTIGDSVARSLGDLSASRPDFSPDGRWLAYSSQASGRWEVFVVPFPNVDAARYQVTTTVGGLTPRWSLDGRSLRFSAEGGTNLMRVPVTIGERFTFGTPQPEFTLPPGSWVIPAPDGRLLMTRPVGHAAARNDEMILVVNFAEELRARFRGK
ncbi:MAG: serine/threonine-protein kinase [Gemmatimonadaceae bacterium]|nr:serine/threonine-protein kinase [Gemmatimonadaceae bacterium]